jgi:hypothetical protein
MSSEFINESLSTFQYHVENFNKMTAGCKQGSVIQMKQIILSIINKLAILKSSDCALIEFSNKERSKIEKIFDARVAIPETIKIQHEAIVIAALFQDIVKSYHT